METAERSVVAGVTGYDAGIFRGEIILHDIIEVDTQHYAFARTHRTHDKP